MIERSFQKITDEELEYTQDSSLFQRFQSSKAYDWNDLLQYKRVFIISESGAGKTYECQEKAKELRNQGKPSFFLELSTLASLELHQMLDAEDADRLKRWLTSSTNEIAIFFLDSIDELQISKGKFKQALLNLKKVISNRLQYVQLVITSRPIAFDEHIVQALFPVLNQDLNATAFAKEIVTPKENHVIKEAQNIGIQNFFLMPFNEEQILIFIKNQITQEPDRLFETIKQKNIVRYAQQPQDLIAICAHWKQHKRILSYKDHLQAIIQIKLASRADNTRYDPNLLSIDKAFEGACRLALAMLLTGCLTLTYDTELNEDDSSTTLNPRLILTNWTQDEIRELIARSLFGLASYGRVRFQHRSFIEYLAAQHLKYLYNQGASLKFIINLLFKSQSNKTVLHMKMRPTAAWLALEDIPRIFELIRDNEPGILIDYGDPESLNLIQKKSILNKHTQRFAYTGSRNEHFSSIQIQRFSTPDLSEAIHTLWNKEITNPELRLTFLDIIKAGKINECEDIAYNCIFETGNSDREKNSGLSALIALNSDKLEDIRQNLITQNPQKWSTGFIQQALICMFPKHLSVENLYLILQYLPAWAHHKYINRALAKNLINFQLEQSELEILRNNLITQISIELKWENSLHHFHTHNPHLCNLLAAACIQGSKYAKNKEWFSAINLYFQTIPRDFKEDSIHNDLKDILSNLTSLENEVLFRTIDKFLINYEHFYDPLSRLHYTLSYNGPYHITKERDLSWILSGLNNQNESIDRKLLLFAAIRLYAYHNDDLNDIRQYITKNQTLINVLKQEIETHQDNKKQSARLIARDQMQTRSQKSKMLETELHYKNLYNDISQNPEIAFSNKNNKSTIYWLLSTMGRGGGFGWDLHFIKKRFEQQSIETIINALKEFWRSNNIRPLLTSEIDLSNTDIDFHNECHMGLAAIYAEASSDSNWAKHLSDEEAILALKYALTEMGQFPYWIKNLLEAHETIISEQLCNQIKHEFHFRQTLSENRLIHKLTPELIKKIIEIKPVLLKFIRKIESIGDIPFLRATLDFLISNQDEDIDKAIIHTANIFIKKENLDEKYFCVWLQILIQLEPELGTVLLENILSTIAIEPQSKAVYYFSELFGTNYHSTVDLSYHKFTPELLFRLIKLAYKHIDPKDDVRHEANTAVQAITRDYAEMARNAIKNTLLYSKGKEAFQVKTRMANSEPFLEEKDYILKIAEDVQIEEIDSNLSITDAIKIDRQKELPIKTNEQMFDVLKDRLADIEELLKSDYSPREIWATIRLETLMRRIIARELHLRSCNLYLINQETVTAEENRTDIRLQSTSSPIVEAVIELKVAEQGWSTKDLISAAKQQLQDQYLAPALRKSGILLITIAGKKTWKHPDTNEKLLIQNLKDLISTECQSYAIAHGCYVDVHILDLRKPDTGLRKKK